MPVKLSGGAKLLLKQIDLSGEAVWIEIKRNECEKSGKVINRTRPFAYRVGDVIDAALFAGANEIDDVSFTVSDDRQAELRDDAIIDAARRASADATSVAGAMGVTIKGPIEISTTGSQFSPYRMHINYDSGYGGMMPMPEAAPMEMGAGPQIQPGDVTVSAQVTVVYEFG